MRASTRLLRTMKAAKPARRGSILVIVAILLVALVGIGALAADFGRYYVVAGELQTAADAAALRGAGALQVLPGQNPSASVQDSVSGFVDSTNLADGTRPQKAPGWLRMAYYTPPVAGGASLLTFDVNVKRPNAVLVRLDAQPSGLFAQLLGRAGIDLRREGVAWIGNVNTGCVHALALPYGRLYEAVMHLPAPATNIPELDPKLFEDYEAQDASQRMFQFLGPTTPVGAPMQPAQQAAIDGTWRGVDFSGSNNDIAYQNNVSGCKQTGLGAAGIGAMTGTVEEWTTLAIKSVCDFRANDSGCYKSGASTPGVAINVVWGDYDASSGTFGPRFRYMGRFTLTCYYGIEPGLKFTQPLSPSPCSGNKPGAPAEGYPDGTFAGFMTGITSANIDQTYEINNTVSNIQRLFLVR